MGRFAFVGQAVGYGHFKDRQPLMTNVGEWFHTSRTESIFLNALSHCAYYLKVTFVYSEGPCKRNGFLNMGISLDLLSLLFKMYTPISLSRS